ncbi:MAG: ATP synthase F1 subunit epsilon [Bacteroidota bacterium]
MLLEIITPDKKIYSGEINSVKLPGTTGSFGVLKNHAPLISSLKKGNVKVIDEQKQNHSFAINGGIVEVLKNKITVLTE